LRTGYCLVILFFFQIEQVEGFFLLFIILWIDTEEK
jgi:hypothetical protein